MYGDSSPAKINVYTPCLRVCMLLASLGRIVLLLACCAVVVPLKQSAAVRHNVVHASSLLFGTVW